MRWVPKVQLEGYFKEKHLLQERDFLNSREEVTLAKEVKPREEGRERGQESTENVRTKDVKSL